MCTGCFIWHSSRTAAAEQWRSTGASSTVRSFLLESGDRCLSAFLLSCYNIFQTHPNCRHPLQLVMEVLTKLEGAYALLIKSRHYPGELVACKRGSPMIVGIKEGPDGSSSSSKVSSGGLGRAASITRLRDQYNDSHWTGALEAWVASDASAVIEHTKRCGGDCVVCYMLWLACCCEHTNRCECGNRAHQEVRLQRRLFCAMVLLPMVAVLSFVCCMLRACKC